MGCGASVRLSCATLLQLCALLLRLLWLMPMQLLL
jgi:hypothetical protein